MKIVVTGTRGIPGIMGGVETHCEELFPRIARKGFDVTVIRRKSYVHDTLRQYEGITLVDLATPKKKSFEAIVHTFRAVLEAKKLKAEIIHIHAVGPALLTPGTEGGIYPPRTGLRPGQMGCGGQNGTQTG